MRTNKDRTQGVLLQGGIQPCSICKMNAADVALLSDFCVKTASKENLPAGGSASQMHQRQRDG